MRPSIDTVHRGIHRLLPCVAGELMGNELRKLDHALETPERPCLAVLGGVKVDDSVQVADNMLRNGIADECGPPAGLQTSCWIWRALTSVNPTEPS